MSTLASQPVAPVIRRLINDADSPSVIAAMSERTAQEQLVSRTQYRDFYTRFSRATLSVTPDVGQLLYALARGQKARGIVEFGTSVGLSTLYLAAALRDNGGGHLVTTELDDAKVARARRNLADAGLLRWVDIRQGDALCTLRQGIPALVDLVFLDGAKALYGDVLDIVEPYLRAGSVVVADNTDISPDYTRRVRRPCGRYLSMPFTATVEVSVWAGH
ncbi:O-methyltransferase [Luteibacter yeojuensis]|uniref:Methyltransferase n=1 Tax=Luteibacter yeojuensis TaxID=345309 RepID=A0A0F3KJ56_9GAMM|nr:class I SAM-dependent methyltransferase [Luteibacter yeojuensis]KJV31295.1 methyltransferase [Luteibacter yeojuensis]